MKHVYLTMLNKPVSRHAYLTLLNKHVSQHV